MTEAIEKTPEQKLNELRVAHKAIQTAMNIAKRNAANGLTGAEDEVQERIKDLSANEVAQNELVAEINQARRQEALKRAQQVRDENMDAAQAWPTGQFDFIEDDPEERCRLISAIAKGLQEHDIFGEDYVMRQTAARDVRHMKGTSADMSE